MPRLYTLLFCALAGFIAPAYAQSYPNKPIRFVVPFPPGGATDVMARALATQLNGSLGQPVIVDNRAGAAGAIGSEAVAKAAPDGYTLLLGTISTHGTNPAVNPKLPYDPVKDFTGVSLLADAPLVLLVNPQAPVNNLQEFLRWAKSSPKPLAYGSNGPGSYNNLAVELFKALTGVDLLHVPYKGAGPAIQDLMAGQIAFGAHDIAGVAPHMRSGKLKALAVASKQRVPGAEAPTAAEAGVPNFEVTAWYALVAPAGTPRETIAQLNAAMNESLREPELRKLFSSQGVELAGGTPAELDAFIHAEIAKWGTIIRAAGFSAN